jgi:8-oxo-dGTP pyrophosphatase MutT (NUDIX family)
MHVIDFNTKIKNKIQAIFVIFFVVDGKPWKGYTNSYGEIADTPIPMCLVVHRWDGSIGFVGGKVDGKETFKETLEREVKEEVGIDFKWEYDPIVAHDVGPITTHAVAVKVSYEELLEIRKKASTQSTIESQTTGFSTPHLVVYDIISKNKKGGLIELYKTSMAPSVREELTHFLLKKKIYTKEQLQVIVKKAGFSLEDLLR